MAALALRFTVRESAAQGEDLNLQSCMERQQGLARPTADGTYGRTEQDFSLSMNVRF